MRLDSFSLGRSLKAGFALAIILVLGVGVISLLTFRHQEQQAQLVNHKYDIVNQAAYIQTLLIDMETGRRGFRSTNDRKFLQSYFQGIQNIDPAFDTLKILASADQALLARVKGLKQEVDTLLNFWASLSGDASKYTKEDIVQTMNREKILMDDVRAAVSTILREQKQELEYHEKLSHKRIDRSTATLIVCIFLILLIVVSLIFKIVHEFRTRRKAEAQTQKNNEDLLIVNQEIANQNWLLAGVAEVNNSLHGTNSLKELSESILNALQSYLQVDSGAIYVYNADDHQLTLTAAYALPAGAKESYALHEGLVGQAAAADVPLIIKDASELQLVVEAGTLKVTPSVAAFVPVILDGETKAIVELCWFNHVSKNEYKLLDVVKKNIAVAIDSSQARDHVLKLLEQVQKQKKELEHQQEELRQINEELNQQAEVLQASEEELRVQEEELRQINAELEAKNHAVETARQSLAVKAKELESISRYKTDFLANMSHELRTPLNSILILAKLLAENAANNLTEKQVSHAKIIHKSGSDLLQLINDILDLSKIESGKMELVYEPVNVSTITTNMQQLFHVVAEEKQMKFEIKADPSVPVQITTDKQKVEQILINLLSNAFKFTPAKGTVSLHTTTGKIGDKPAIKFIVSDTGIGIPAPKQQLIFQAFQQADSSTSRKFGGTGLGLSIISRLVELLGGTIELKSAENEGSTFTVTIPVTGKAETAQSSTSIAKPQLPAAIPEQKQVADDRAHLMEGDKRMLIIEDDASLARMIFEYAHANNYKAIVAMQGDEGLYYAKVYQPDVIILDMKLPGMDGATVLRMLKNDPDLHHIPVHIISSLEDGRNATGAFSFLKKPFNTADLDKAFADIGKYLSEAVKHVLLISADEANRKELVQLLQSKKLKVQCDIVATMQQAAAKLSATKYDTIIADLSNNIKEGINQLDWLHKQVQPQQVPIIVYIDEDIQQAKELELKKLADVVVRKSLYSQKRLIDEIELFLNKVNETVVPANNQEVVHGISENILAGKKILLVDDDMRNVFALNAALEQHDMQVMVANDGKEAIRCLQEDANIDLVLMDVMMPEMDGYEATRIIRNQLHLNDLPIIALTAKAMAEDKEKCIQAGASDYITKPVDVQKLISLMRVWLA
ncbi:response regulator [Aridibaculum aurantiacum]|uniref:response regulator n=1 Tax=Aridibaculum aurantiacum TaxID=2810307 RepID=UPI001A975D87|nr:response regulator [Aridibaculum aurantiacum]